MVWTRQEARRGLPGTQVSIGRELGPCSPLFRFTLADHSVITVRQSSLLLGVSLDGTVNSSRGKNIC